MSLLNQPRWPVLKVPPSSWKTANEKILFTCVLNRIGESNQWTHIGRREVQLELSRVGGARVSEKLKSFYEYGYLQRKEPRPISQAYEYRINPDFLKTEGAREWICFARVLFSPVNPWKKLLRRSSIGHGYLNASGIIVLGAITSAEVGVSTGQLQEYLRGLVSEATVRTCVKNQTRNSLVFRNHKQLLVPSKDLLSLLAEYEANSGAKMRSKRVSKEVASQRRNFMGF
jgi:hypothetical protein